MQRIKARRKQRKIIKYILLGNLMVIITLSFFSYKFINQYLISNKESRSIKYYLDKIKNNDINDDNEELMVLDNNKLINYIAVLEIPKINLIRGLVDKDDSTNNVNKNIEILDESTMPNIEHSNLYLASHSGNTSVSYFKKLDRLIYQDEVYIYYDNTKYIYEVTKLYEIEKNGYDEINKNNSSKKNLILITCIDGTNKQLVIICELKGEVRYEE